MEYSSEEREMEVEALQSIYGEQFTVMVDNPAVTYELKLQQTTTKIIFTIPEKYPDVPPSISCVTEHNQPVHTELVSLLYNSAQQSCGEVMIYNLVEEANDWIKKHEFAEQMTSSQGEEKSCEDVATICKFFLEGKCRFGNKCFNKHEELTSVNSNTKDGSLHSHILTCEETEKCSTQVNEKPDEASKSVKNSGNRHPETEEFEGSKKKPPMKTASDVISRIQWDEELSPKDFVVGYLDRFIGNMEKSFTDFSWEDLASVDHFVDLAIPRHRIQYFKYQGEIVWDKRERVDRVFGSTGSKETILDVKNRIGNHQESNEGQSTTETEDASFVASELPMPVKEKNGPNYFIAVQISDERIIDNIIKIQNTIQLELGQEEEYELIPRERLHVTLLMLTLHTEDHVAIAKSILKSVQPLLVSILPPSHKLQFNGLGQFHNRILYAKVEADAALSKLAQALKFKFDKAGISLEGNRDPFVPHLTIMRGRSRDLLSPSHVQKRLSDLMKASYDIGEQRVESLVLFSRFLPKDVDGTHSKVSTVENSLRALSSTLPRKLCQYVDHLFESEKLCEQERNDIQALFQSGDALELDEGLSRLVQLNNQSQDRTVLIMRGIPGSGKTHLAENSEEATGRSGYTYCSARQLFHKTGASVPDPSELNIAEAYCRSCFLDAMANLSPFVVVDGVHSKCWEYAVYQCLARAFGYACHVLEIRVTQPEDIKLCHQNCSSGTQLERLLEDVQGWEEDPEATVIEPWFGKPDTLKYSDSVSLKQLLNAS